MRRGPAVAALVVVAIVAILLWRREDLAETRGTGTDKMVQSRKAGAASSEAVLSIEPGKRGAPRVLAVRNPPSALMREYTEAHDHKKLYERLKVLPKRSGEESYLLATILEKCAKVEGKEKEREQRGKWTLGSADARNRFAESLSPKAPDRDKRLAAFDAVNFNDCAGLEDVATNEKAIRALFDEAAAAGDPKGRLQQLQRQLQDQQRNAKGEVEFMKPVDISDAQIDTWKQVMASGDPRAVVDAVSMLFSLSTSVHLRGLDEAPIDFGSLYQAGTLAACSLGRDCGPNMQYLQRACAFQGQCDVADYRDYLFFYGAAPGTSQRTAQYEQQLLHAIQQGDWSSFTFHRGPTPGLAAFQRP